MHNPNYQSLNKAFSLSLLPLKVPHAQFLTLSPLRQNGPISTASGPGAPVGAYGRQ
jgi:hypothetical protein